MKAFDLTQSKGILSTLGCWTKARLDILIRAALAYRRSHRDLRLFGRLGSGLNKT